MLISRISIKPGKKYDLPLVFCPKEENVKPGRLVISTVMTKWEIELAGLGREAVLIISKVSLEFVDCIIGNCYEQVMTLKNIGDVNYPVTFKTDKPIPELEFSPPSLIIQPFSEAVLTVAFVPTADTKVNRMITVNSPYSITKLPITLHAGHVKLQFDRKLVDFGLFEKTTSPVQSVIIKNIGSVKTNFFIKDLIKPSRFLLENYKGLLEPGKTVELKIRHIRHDVYSFTETLSVKTDLIDEVDYITVKGHCEEAVLIPTEFTHLNMGICPISDTSMKTLKIKNHGRFPIDFEMKASYPLKVSPASGSINGGDIGNINVIWMPSGAYELRSQLNMETNIGNYAVLVKGRSVAPELHILNDLVDFGVCAVNQVHKKNVQITNKGKVSLRYMVPAPKEAAYTIPDPHGILEPKESRELVVLFHPKEMNKYMCNLIFECKGVAYKEATAIGIGGLLEMSLSKNYLDASICPCFMQNYECFEIRNSGDVILDLDFQYKIVSGKCQVAPPGKFRLLPKQTCDFWVGFTALNNEDFAIDVTVVAEQGISQKLRIIGNINADS
jgi:hypothetical protein